MTNLQNLGLYLTENLRHLHRIQLSKEIIVICSGNRVKQINALLGRDAEPSNLNAVHNTVLPQT